MTGQRSSTAPELNVAWDQVRTQLRALIGRLVSDPEAVEDLVQDVLLRASTAAASGEQFSSLSAWLNRVARNAVIDYYRTRRRRVPLDEAAALADPSAWPYPDEGDDQIAARELAQCLRPLIEQLPNTARDALILTDLHGPTQAAAASALGLSVSGMKSRVQRARRELRALLVACCPVTLDRRGAITDYVPATTTCACDGATTLSGQPRMVDDGGSDDGLGCSLTRLEALDFAQHGRRASSEASNPSTRRRTSSRIARTSAIDLP